ncbi:MAG TPA: hypothetical protein VEV41_21250 [Terriglobales bacterium]|nr:hypothetical protein [Terriglobales bacterium]
MAGSRLFDLEPVTFRSDMSPGRHTGYGTMMELFQAHRPDNKTFGHSVAKRLSLGLRQ